MNSQHIFLYQKQSKLLGILTICRNLDFVCIRQTHPNPGILKIENLQGHLAF